MTYALQCGLCKHRWRYSGSAPWEALAGHQAKAHPDEKVGASPIVQTREVVEREPGEDI